MGDGIKLSKDKRHRSSSSLAGAAVEGTRSERKLDLTCLDLRDSIPEVEDQFALAEARCEKLQEKIDLVKVIKRKKKLKKRSLTRVNDPSVPPENMSIITVRTQPKKKAIQSRIRRLEAPNPVRGYVDPADEEQHRMLGAIRGFEQAYDDTQHYKVTSGLGGKKFFTDHWLPNPGYLDGILRPRRKTENTHSSRSMEPNLSRTQVPRARADGDRPMYGRGIQNRADIGLARTQDQDEFSDYENYNERPGDFIGSPKKKPVDVRQTSKTHVPRRRHVPREFTTKTAGGKWMGEQRREQPPWRTSPERPRKPTHNNATSQLGGDMAAERPVIEIFNNPRTNAAGSPMTTRPPNVQDRKCNKEVREPQRREPRALRDPFGDQTTGPLGDGSTLPVKKKERRMYSKRYRNHRYELPTMASQMKQSSIHFYQGARNHPNIPFVVSKSTAPSHNIGVNIQQVLNGLKVQQPLTGIPPTIAHHMGLGHVSTAMAKNNNISWALSEHRAMNAIKLGRRLVRLPSSKYMSYNRMLNLYREGDGMVPRFLRAISRPHYFYTSMYNLATAREDLDGATSKGNAATLEAKQTLAEYASLYREYEKLDKALREGKYDPECERRRDEISKELATREEQVRKMVQDYKGSDADLAPLRASASTADDGRRRSSYKLED